MALTPQMLVPAAIRIPNRSEIPILFDKNIVIPSAATMQTNTIPTATTPIFSTENMLSRIPISIMPNWSRLFIPNFIPGLKLLPRLIEFLTAIPSTIANNIGLIGFCVEESEY